jgi:starch synthase
MAEQISAEAPVGPEVVHGGMETISRNASLSLFRDIDIADLDAEAEASVPQYDSKYPDVPIVIVSSEINPWSKTGGLALVTASLAVEFAERGRRTMAISPMYDNFEGLTWCGKTTVWLFHGEHEVNYYHKWHQISENKGVDYIFVDHPCYHRPGGLYYNAEEGCDYGDNLYRFSLFCLAALEAPCMAPQIAPFGDKVLFLANDWQTAMLPIYLTHRMRPQHRFKESRCVFVVHNFGYQGIYPCNKLENVEGCTLPVIVKNVDIHDFGLEGTMAYEHMIYQYPEWQRNYEGDDGHVWNLTKGALVCSDRILTVSPGYGQEMKTPEGGFSLDGMVRDKEFFMGGILNGIDINAWNPRADPTLVANYDENSFVEGKLACKQQLQEACGLQQDPNMALVAFVGRLTMQKGIDIILEAIDWMMMDTGNHVTGHIQLIILGNGDEVHVRAINEKVNRYHGRVAGLKFDPKLEHLLYAGSDLLIMPSRYEPCGLPQMCAQRYGAVPIVTLCGGLKDSVIVEPEEEATGFGILPLSADKMKEVVYKACQTCLQQPEVFQAMQMRGMTTDFSWCPRIDEYMMNFDWCLNDPPFVR